MSTDNFRQINPKLSKLWDIETGFFFKLREGSFDRPGYKELLAVLKLCPREIDSYPLETIRYIWMIPHFMDWQKDRVLEHSIIDASEYEACLMQVIEAIQSIWGTP